MDDHNPTEEQIREVFEAFQMEGKEGIEKVLLKREVQKLWDQIGKTDSSEKTE